MKLELDKNNNEKYLKPILWNSIINVFNQKKGINIEEYLVSISLQNNTFFVKTNNPLINSEILSIEDDIEKDFKKKIKNLLSDSFSFEIKYV